MEYIRAPPKKKSENPTRNLPSKSRGDKILDSCCAELLSVQHTPFSGKKYSLKEIIPGTFVSVSLSEVLGPVVRVVLPGIYYYNTRTAVFVVNKLIMKTPTQFVMFHLLFAFLPAAHYQQLPHNFLRRG